MLPATQYWYNAAEAFVFLSLVISQKLNVTRKTRSLDYTSSLTTQHADIFMFYSGLQFLHVFSLQRW